MPKYFASKVAGYYLYFTTHCIVEAMHAHASDSRLAEEGSAKLFVRSDGSTVVQRRGRLTDRELRQIQEFIKLNYQDMYAKWSEYSTSDFYHG